MGPSNCGVPYPSCSTVPLPVLGLAGVASVSVGYQYACALASDGSVKCWGDDTYGQLGDGRTQTLSASPVAVTW